MKRRMSIERLALLHLVATAGIGKLEIGAQQPVIICFEDFEGVQIGETFAHTLALSAPNLDLFEESVEVRHLEAVPA